MYPFSILVIMVVRQHGGADGMKAIVIHDAGDLRIEERACEPPGAGEVLVAVKAGGICGSDLHYYNHGGFGVVRVVEPMVLGHEVAGIVEAVGPGTSGIAAGDRVAINPSRPCGTCRYCVADMPNQCLDMRFYGSAMRRPHVDGAFRQKLVADAAQCVVVPDGVSMNEAACAEPLSVVLHAAGVAGSLKGARVLVTGCGPIGCLAVMVAKAQGAREIVATDLVSEALQRAEALGADIVLNGRDDVEALAAYGADKGHFDVMFEASGSSAALATGLHVVRPRGNIVQLGLGGDVTVPLNMLVAKEISLKGSFRFHEEFAMAVQMIGNREIDVRDLISDVVGLGDAEDGFRLANDRSRSMKVQIDFTA
jgi:L-idonate 5-dehydrogenase